MSIQSNILEIQDTINAIPASEKAQILAVTKYASIEQTQAVIDCGLTTLGESRIQEASRKQAVLTDPGINWHMIGHLQTNKVNKAVSMFSCIQSVDSLRLLEKISEACAKQGKKIDILLQINIANDPAKYGFGLDEFLEQKEALFAVDNLQIKGIMVMIPLCESLEHCRKHFSKAKSLFDQLQQDYPHLDTLSMGMSQDYSVAIEEGSTLIRIGSRLFK